MVKVSRKHIGALCRALMLSETDDREKINDACECMEKVWNSARDEDIYRYSIAADKRYKHSASDDVNDVSEQELESIKTSRRCTERAGIAANSQYKRDLADRRKDVLARRQAEHLLRAVDAALRLYRLNHHHYPSNTQGLGVLLEETSLERIPIDAWGNEIGYTLSADGNDFEVVSFGRDGKPGGTGFDQDVLLDDQ